MPNEANRRNLKAQMDCLSDAHKELVDRAVKANNNLILADNGDTASNTRLNFADRQLAYLLEDLEAQRKRILRVAAEVEEIKKNLRQA